MATVTICSDFRAPPKNSVTISIVSPSIYNEVMGPDAIALKREKYLGINFTKEVQDLYTKTAKHHGKKLRKT